MGESHLAPAPTAVYGVILLLAAIAYRLLQHVILREEGPDSMLGAAVGSDRKGKTSVVIYAIAIPVAFLRPWMAGALYVAGALMWLVPDRRIERRVACAHVNGPWRRVSPVVRQERTSRSESPSGGADHARQSRYSLAGSTVSPSWLWIRRSIRRDEPVRTKSLTVSARVPGSLHLSCRRTKPRASRILRSSNRSP
jgi:hypothetical protein